jgi:hypothetical protein
MIATCSLVSMTAAGDSRPGSSSLRSEAGQDRGFHGTIFSGVCCVSSGVAESK